MLLALRISNFTVMEEVEVGFGPGLTVLTGETGAGKSILVDALGLLLGGRADADVVADRARTRRWWRASSQRTPALAERLEALGLPDLGDEVVLRRVVGRTGRGKAYVNGALVTVGVLGRLMRGRWTSPASTSTWACSSLPPTARCSTAARASASRSRRTGRRMRRWWRWTSSGSRWAATRLPRRPGRVRPLPAGRDRAARAGARRGGGARGGAETAGRRGAAPRIRARIRGAARCGGRGGVHCGRPRREDAGGGREDGPRPGRGRHLGGLGRRRAGGRGPEPPALPGRAGGGPGAAVHGRGAAGRAPPACRKHATDVPGLPARHEALRIECERLEGRRERLLALDAERSAAEARAWEAARSLRRERERAARRIERAVGSELGRLALPRAAFEVQLAPRDVLRADGADEVEFLFSANPGEPVRPLAQVASGGEASRLWLALKRTSMARGGLEEAATVVLDEADAGVSGAVADVVGRMVRAVASGRQVLCITHLPQVRCARRCASAGGEDLVAGPNLVQVRVLDAGAPRTRELARMMSGVRSPREALGAAEALVRRRAGVGRTAERPEGLARATGGVSRGGALRTRARGLPRTAPAHAVSLLAPQGRLYHRWSAVRRHRPVEDRLRLG